MFCYSKVHIFNSVIQKLCSQYWQVIEKKTVFLKLERYFSCLRKREKCQEKVGKKALEFRLRLTDHVVTS